MSGWAKNGVMYPCSGVYAIDDNVISPSSGWSSKKVMDKLASVKNIIRVDEKPTLADGTITYVKDGTSYTTTDQEAWFYYVADDELYKTIFIDDVEFTKPDSSVSFDDFIEKTDIVTTIDETVTNAQVVGALTIKEELKTLSNNMVSSDDLAKNFTYLASYLNASAGDNLLDTTTESLVLCALSETNNAELFNLFNDGFAYVMTYFYNSITETSNRCQIAIGYTQDKMAFRLYKNGWHPWKIVASTSVKDVPLTNITTFEDSRLSGNVQYCVKNGVCYVYVNGLTCTEKASNVIVCKNMPKPMMTGTGTGIATQSNSNVQMYAFVSGNTNVLKIHSYVANSLMYGSLSYPVAEDWQP